ncbi:unnamed protein product [Leptosia nina]|uniref:Uncharacterized protein n=1 Tax=Leptosia nina TaxID=320188 RepID=A0AAV1JVY4_9NEOP
MGKKTVTSVNKSKEKRQARKLEQRRIADGMGFVTKANKLEDLAGLCKELLVYKSNELDVEMYIQKVMDLDKNTLQWAIDLTERNMKSLYETCAWGWNRDRKVEEMTDDAAWYLIAKDKDNLLAFSHFRFDMDFGVPVLYWKTMEKTGEFSQKLPLSDNLFRPPPYTVSAKVTKELI